MSENLEEYVNRMGPGSLFRPEEMLEALRQSFRELERAVVERVERLERSVGELGRRTAGLQRYGGSDVR